MAELILIHLNGVQIQTVGRTLHDIVAAQGLEGMRVATALNGTFVAERARHHTAIGPGDTVEIVSARPGG